MLQAPFEIEPLVEFLDAIKTAATRKSYLKRLSHFFDDIQIEGPTLQVKAKTFIEKARADNQWATSVVLDFIRAQKERVERGEIVGATVDNQWKPIKLLLQENDILLNFKKISRRIPPSKSHGNDRAPTTDEIKAIIANGGRRMKPIVLTMISSGIRVGAWDYLRWGDVEPIKSGDELAAAKLTVYSGEPEQYFSFITPEAYKALKEYVDFRERSGEKISPSSWLMRDIPYGDHLGKQGHDITRPKRLTAKAVKREVEDALRVSGIRPAGVRKKRWEFQAVHGFRKYWKTVCECKMKTLHVELLMGHQTGLNANYYRPKEADLLEDYLKAVLDLTLFERPAKETGKDIASVKKELSELKARIAQMEAYNQKVMTGSNAQLAQLEEETLVEQQDDFNQIIAQSPVVDFEASETGPTAAQLNASLTKGRVKDT